MEESVAVVAAASQGTNQAAAAVVARRGTNQAVVVAAASWRTHRVAAVAVIRTMEVVREWNSSGGHNGTLPCLRRGSSSRLVANMRSPATSFWRVSAGSITSSM